MFICERLQLTIALKYVYINMWNMYRYNMAGTKDKDT